MGAPPLLTAKTLPPLAKHTGSPQGPGHGQRASPALDGGGLWQWREGSKWLEVTPSPIPRKAEVRPRHPLTQNSGKLPPRHLLPGGCAECGLVAVASSLSMKPIPSQTLPNSLLWPTSLVLCGQPSGKGLAIWTNSWMDLNSEMGPALWTDSKSAPSSVDGPLD